MEKQVLDLRSSCVQWDTFSTPHSHGLQLGCCQFLISSGRYNPPPQRTALTMGVGCGDQRKNPTVALSNVTILRNLAFYNKNLQTSRLVYLSQIIWARHIYTIFKNMNTIKSHYLYNVNSSNIYKYWVTTVHAEVRKVHSRRT